MRTVSVQVVRRVQRAWFWRIYADTAPAMLTEIIHAFGVILDGSE